MDKLVSIVVPVYNAEKYIMNCIEALRKQTYTDIEIILVDDGSSDASGKLCDEMQTEDARIKVVHKQNGGVSSARNCGVQIATGDYLMFADSDDFPDARWTERMVELAEHWNVNLVISGYRMVKNYNEAKVPIDHVKAFEPVWAMMREEFYQVLGYMMTFRETMFCPWNKLFETKIVKEHGILFPENMSYGEDFLFNLQYLEYCNGVIETREKLYNYIVQNPESLEAKYKTDLYENQYSLYCAAKKFMIEHHVYNGYNVSNLAYYYVNRTIASIKNLFHEENERTELESRKYVEEILQNPDLIESVYLLDMRENEEQAVFSDLMKAKRYTDVYDAMRNIEKFKKQDQSTVRYRKFPEQVSGWRWIPYTFKSIKKYGVVITTKRIIGKLQRKIRG